MGTGTAVYRAPEWSEMGSVQILEFAEKYTAGVKNSTPGAPEYLTALLWLFGAGAAPVTGRPDQPVTEGVAEVEWWSALAATDPATMHLAPLREISQEVNVAYLPPRDVGLQAADATWMVLATALGLADQHGPHSLRAWLYEGATPTAEELFRDAAEGGPGLDVPRERSYWTAVYRRAQRTAIRHRRMAVRMRDVEARCASTG